MWARIFTDFTMVCVKTRFSNKSYFMKINSLICIANQLFCFFMIRGCTEGKFFLCSLSKASESLEHFIIMGDFNIDVTNGVEFYKLVEFCDLFNLTNLITSPTFFTKTHNYWFDFN